MRAPHPLPRRRARQPPLAVASRQDRLARRRARPACHLHAASNALPAPAIAHHHPHPWWAPSPACASAFPAASIASVNDNVDRLAGDAGVVASDGVGGGADSPGGKGAVANGLISGMGAEGVGSRGAACGATGAAIVLRRLCPATGMHRIGPTLGTEGAGGVTLGPGVIAVALN